MKKRNNLKELLLEIQQILPFQKDDNEIDEEIERLLDNIRISDILQRLPLYDQFNKGHVWEKILKEIDKEQQ